MLKSLRDDIERNDIEIEIAKASFPAPFKSGLEYSSPARGTWNIVHTGMLIPEAHQIFVCAAGCLRGVVLTAAEMHAEKRFSTVEIKESNLLDGDLEDLVIEGVTDIINKLPKRPPAVLVYTSCVHHFTGCDLDMIYAELAKRFPDIDFTDCYMNPIMRKSGLTPDQIMRSRLYKLLKKRELNDKCVAIIGNDLPTLKSSELLKILNENDFKVHEITDKKTYADYQQMAESSIYFSYYPAAKAAGDLMSEQLGGKHVYLPFSYDYDEIDASLKLLCDSLGIDMPDTSKKRKECDMALKDLKELIKDKEIAIDYTFCQRPLSLAIMLLKAGMNVKYIFADSFTGEEKNDFDYLQKNHPDLLLFPTVHAKMRFFASKEESDILAVGQKAAYFTNTNHFVNVVEGGGMFGYDAIIQSINYMKDAYNNKKDMCKLVQIKGLGCDYCS
ncbi:MAG: nitrogenase [Lachnospiraceae bacterium]|nr:nitrogenase [Lachnospiraceae bacterium]